MARLTAALTGAVATVALIAGCAGGSPESADGTERLTLAVTLDSGSWDPALLQNGHQAQYWNAVYDTLLQLEEDATIVPGLAETWEYNDDRTVLTLGLREGVEFTDGTPFDATAVKVNLERLRDGTGQNSIMASSIADVVVVDEHTAELHLTAPDPALLTYLTLVGGAIGSPAAVVEDSISTTPVGTGPYILDAAQTEPGVRFIFTRNPDYWDAESYPYDELELIVMGDLTARLNALRSGQIDGMAADGTAVVEAEASGLSVHSWPLNRRGLYIADRDGTVVPALADVRVRQAINYALDSEGILQGIQQGYGSRSTQIFNPTSPAFVPELNDDYPFDPEKARELLAEAGYPDGFDLVMPENPNEKSNTIVQQQLADVGIRVTYDKVDATNYVAEVQSGRYGMFWMSNSTAESWWDMSKQVPAEAPWNPFSTSTPELDLLIEEARSATEDAAFEEAMQEISTYLVENAWFDIWYLEDVIYVTSADVDVALNPTNVVPFISGFTPAS